MAIGIQNYPNIDTTDPTNYPAGNLKDSITGTNGTPVNKLTNADIHQTFYRALSQAKITPSGDPDNATNGYQYAQAFGLEAWINAGTTITTTGFTVDTSDVVYNRYRIVGNTLYWQLRIVSATISGSPTALTVRMPAAILTSGKTIVNSNMRTMGGVYNQTTPMITEIVAGGINYVNMYLISNAAFTNGTNNQILEISVVAELT